MDANKYIDNVNYTKFIHKSRYSRYLSDKQRRENWEETVGRLSNFWKQKFPELHEVIKDIESSIISFEVMPSMRSLLTAGPALDRDNMAGFNCTAIAIDSPKAFDEIMYLLLVGSGVGFSVERQNIQKLPNIAEEFYETDTTIVVQDSKIGWASSFRELISLLYSGKVPKFDLSKVRPAGSILKTFGGRASGPTPLQELFDYSINVFKNAAGRRLTSLECHGIVCKIGEIVIVGGVRRCCFHKYLVRTENGLKQLNEVVPGDKVYFNGEYITVNNVFNNGVQDTINIKMEDGTTHICTEEHRWFVYDHDDGKLKWKETKELAHGRYSMLKPKATDIR